MHAGTPFTLAANNILSAAGSTTEAKITSSYGFQMTTTTKHAIGVPLANISVWASGSCGTAYLCGYGLEGFIEGSFPCYCSRHEIGLRHQVLGKDAVRGLHNKASH